MSALKDIPSEFALEVVEDTTLISFNFKKYYELISNHTDLKNFYISYLEHNWIVQKKNEK